MTEGEEEAVMATEAAHTPRLALTVGAGAQEDHQPQQQLPSASSKLQGKLQALKHKVQKRRVERRLSQYQQHLLEAQHWRSKCWSEVQRKTRTKKPRFEAVRNLDQFKRYDRWEQTQFREVNWKQFYEDMTGRRGKHLHDYFNSPWTLSSIFLLVFCQLYLLVNISFSSPVLIDFATLSTLYHCNLFVQNELLVVEPAKKETSLMSQNKAKK
ncbi:hypothetical protein QOT17_001208 [Balamuthia mandrillaris]